MEELPIRVLKRHIPAEEFTRLIQLIAKPW